MFGAPPSPAKSLPSWEMLKWTDHSSRGSSYLNVAADVRRLRSLSDADEPTELWSLLTSSPTGVEAKKNFSPRGICRSNQIRLPSGLQNSCPAISSGIVRRCMRRGIEDPPASKALRRAGPPSSDFGAPSEDDWGTRMVQIRSTSCHGPS